MSWAPFLCLNCCPSFWCGDAQLTFRMHIPALLTGTGVISGPQVFREPLQGLRWRRTSPGPRGRSFSLAGHPRCVPAHPPLPGDCLHLPTSNSVRVSAVWLCGLPCPGGGVSLPCRAPPPSPPPPGASRARACSVALFFHFLLICGGVSLLPDPSPLLVTHIAKTISWWSGWLLTACFWSGRFSSVCSQFRQSFPVCASSLLFKSS